MCMFYSAGKKLELYNNEIEVINFDDVIQIADPITIEFRYIKITSDEFDRIGKSEIMIVNNLRTNQTKEKSMDIITYYDDDVKVDKFYINGHKYKTWNVHAFDPSEYGNPICYHNMGYRDETITITTRAWEIDKSGPVDKAFGCI